jgi:hypothetical protein
MATYWSSDDFAINPQERRVLVRMAAEYPASPTAEQDQEFVNNVRAEFGWGRAAGQYFGLVGAPERVAVVEE